MLRLRWAIARLAAGLSVRQWSEIVDQEEGGLFQANAVNDVDAGRDRATPED